MMSKPSLQAVPEFSSRLLKWFDQHGRKDLPWQQDKTPYRVWVSEIMLQQTQVAAVIGYYENFMTHFPDLETLAQADTDAVLQHWAGLGYYARARNLHKAAQAVYAEHAGKFPDTLDGLIELPGIGRSTAGAIISIALGKPAAILDGNVKRVLIRIWSIQTWPGERHTETALWQLAEELTPEHRVDDYTQAIMDLGATLCTRSKPRCEQCPFQNDCQAFRQGLQNSIPAPKPKKSIPTRTLWMARVESSDGHLLLEKRPETGIWGGLYSLPEFPESMNEQQVLKELSLRFGIQPEKTVRLRAFHHVFSHYKLKVLPLGIETVSVPDATGEENGFDWHKIKDLRQLGLPAPIKKFLQQPLAEAGAIQQEFELGQTASSPSSVGST